jgi:hypothetical protein
MAVQEETSRQTSDNGTLLNAVIGAVATAVLSGFVPFAPLFGGGIAGYLEGGTRNDGLKVGAISGGIALVFAMLLFGVFFLFGFGLVALDAPAALPAVGILFLLFALVIGLIYIVGLSAAGGWIGNYVKYETDLGS